MAPFLFLATPWVRFSEEGGNEETQDYRHLYDQTRLLAKVSQSTRDGGKQPDQGAGSCKQPVEEERDRGRVEAVVEPAGQAVAQEADKRGDLEYGRSCGVGDEEEQLYQGGEDEQKNEQLAESMEDRVGWMLT